MVAVFEEVARRVEVARAEVDGQHHLGAGGLAPAAELVGADLVGFAGPPRQVEAHRALILRADAILPAIGRDEIAAGIANQGRIEIANEAQHVAAKPVLVGGLVAGLINAAIDSPAEMLKKCAVDPVVDWTDRKILVDRDARPHSYPPPYVSRYMICIL